MVAASGKWAFVEISSLPGTGTLRRPHGPEAAVASSGLVGRAGLKDGGSRKVVPLGNSLVGNKGSLFNDSSITIIF